MNYRYNPDNEIVSSLKRLLADTYLLYIETQGAHWNIVGPEFPQLHALFEAQYTELSLANDLLAEHIRTYGASAPASAREFLSLTSIQEIAFTETSTDHSDATFILESLIGSHEACVKTAEYLGEITGEALHTQNLAADRIEAHNKAIWMLQATLDKRAPKRYRHRSRSRRNPWDCLNLPTRRRNPWAAGDVKRHNKACASKASCRRKWPSIANAVLRDSGDEGKAIRIANWQAKRMGLYRRY